MKNYWCSGFMNASLFVLLSGSAMATEYHVDSNAASGGNGTLATPFKNLTSLPALASGDVVKLARGSEWPDATIAVNTHVTIESYGNPVLGKPILSGSRLIPYSDSALNASETLQDANDPASGIITMHASSGTLVHGAFINEEFPLYINAQTPTLSCTGADRTKQRYWYANLTLQICRASLPPDTIIQQVRMVTRPRVIDLTTPGTDLTDPVKYIKISGLDIRYPADAGIGGSQIGVNVNFGNIYIENNDFHGIINTSICLCTGTVASPQEYDQKGDKFNKLKISGNRFYAHGREAIYIGPKNSSFSIDPRPIEIVDNIFGETSAAKPFLISGWNMNTNSGSEAVDIKQGNGNALVARNVFRWNMKKKAVFAASFGVEISRNTINNRFEPGGLYSKATDAANSAIWHQFEPPPGTMDGGLGEVLENSITNGKGSGILFRGATGIPAQLTSARNQIYLDTNDSCSGCLDSVDGNGAIIIRGKTGFVFSLADNVARGGKYAVRRFEEPSITPSLDDDMFRADPTKLTSSGYCNTNLTGIPVLSSPICKTGAQDSDGDFIDDFVDNCPALSNAGQADKDGNGIGDACDLAWQTNDVDGDGIYNADDNCRSVANSDQIDFDRDGIGDTCDHGLTATYFNDGDTDVNSEINEHDAKLVGAGVYKRIEPNIDFNYGLSASPDVAVALDYFSARFTGRLIVPAYTGTYTFCLRADDGVRLWINDVSLWGDAHWRPQDSVRDCATVALVAGQSVPIRMEFFDLTEEAIAKLEWSWPGQAEHVVPTTSLYAQ